jgi:hydrophobic/amphiphilic exporter-1 (mainly G- bacteria), HAE1 family
MKSLARFAVDNPVTVWMFILAMVLLGGISLSKLGTDLFPNLNNPKLFIEVSAGERSPEELETRIVENLEALAVRQKGVQSVSSELSVGIATITVAYNFGQNMDEAFLDMQKAIGPLEQSAGVDELVLSRFDPNASPVLEVSLVANVNQSLSDLQKIAEKYIVNDLIRLEGIADVKLNGGLLPQVIINTNDEVLKVNNLSPSSISNALSAYNRTVSGGYIEESGQRYIIKGTAVFVTPSDLNNLVVGYRSSAASTTETASDPILLSDVATVTLGESEPENLLTFDGKPCLGISIYKETNFNTVKAVDAVNKELASIGRRLPGFSITVVDNQGAVISSAINEVRDSALIGIVLAVLVLFVFLRRIGVTLVISVAIPISILATFNLMYFNGLTLNVMTLGGLALGAGMLVDNAIVAVENIFRHIEQGKSLRDASIDGIAGVGGALVASTLTTIVVFLPVVYLQGASGELFKDQAWTVAFSLLSSLFVALLLIPVLVNLFFPSRQKAITNPVVGIKFQWYANALKTVLDNKNKVIGFALALVAVSFFLVRFVGQEFMPTYQSNELEISVKMPAGTSLLRTADVVARVGDVAQQLSEGSEAHVYSYVGKGSTTAASEGQTASNNSGRIKLMLKAGANTNSSSIIAGLEAMFKDVPGLALDYQAGGSGLTDVLGTNVAPFEVQVFGKKLDNLVEATKMVRDKLATVNGLVLSYSSFEEGAPEVAIKIDRYRAGMFNVDVATIMSQVSQFLQGIDGGNMDVDGELIDIRLKLPDATLNQLKNLKIKSGTGEYLLSELADIVVGEAPATLSRINQSRIGKVQGYPLGTRSYSQLVADANQQLAALELPADCTVKMAGEEVKRQESFGNLVFALILAVVLVYMVMASQFESLVHPFTILLSIPLAGVGVVLLFLAMGQSFNVMALIGVVMLGGIAVNNAILLVDAINQNKWAGMAKRDAIITAAQQRIRPILMTTATTVLALLPLTFGFGESASLRAPMALAVIGGLTTSTLLTLVVIPCVYDLFDKFTSGNDNQNHAQ